MGEYKINISSLLEKLNEIGVPKRYYSINGHLSSDTYILNQIYNKWEYFYFDEKGNKNDYKIFDNECDACYYLLRVLEDEMKY